MKYALAFLAAFVVVATAVAVIRLNVSNSHADHGNRATETDGADAHAGHKTDPPSGPGKPRQAGHPLDGAVRTDLKNKTDPVNGVTIGDDHDKHFHTVFHGFLIHFATDDTLARFKRRPTQFMQKLGLEQTSKGDVLKVDASSYRNPPVIPDVCPMMGGDVDPDGDVYILHRGWRIYFCCWMGCATDFLADPTPHYAVYGLTERDGKLVAKE